jgi:hypothetical protein
MTREGTRGGTVATLDEAQTLFATWRGESYGWLQAHILRLAVQRGEYHADMTAHLELPEANLIGAAVNALAKRGLIEKLNRDGLPEHRAATSNASHGRGSWVWRPTLRGTGLLTRAEFANMAPSAPPPPPQTETLFDVPTTTRSAITGQAM